MGTACDRERDSVPKRELIAMETYQKLAVLKSQCPSTLTM
jgi:hypothetical protein